MYASLIQEWRLFSVCLFAVCQKWSVHVLSEVRVTMEWSCSQWMVKCKLREGILLLKAAPFNTRLSWRFMTHTELMVFHLIDVLKNVESVD